MDNATALQAFERYLQRRYPGRSTAKHYVSDVRLFQAACPKRGTNPIPFSHIAMRQSAVSIYRAIYQMRS